MENFNAENLMIFNSIFELFYYLKRSKVTSHSVCVGRMDCHRVVRCQVVGITSDGE